LGEGRKDYGESEVYIKGGNEPSVTASVEKPAEAPAAATLASDEKVAGGLKSEENVAPAGTEPIMMGRPIQSNGAQSNGNIDVWQSSLIRSSLLRETELENDVFERRYMSVIIAEE